MKKYIVSFTNKKMTHIGELYGKTTIPIHINWLAYESVLTPPITEKAQFIMDVMHMAHIVNVYPLIPASLPPFGKVALAFYLCETSFKKNAFTIRSVEQWKSLLNIIQKLITYVPHLQTKWNESTCIQIDADIQEEYAVYQAHEIAWWIGTIRDCLFDSYPIAE